MAETILKVIKSPSKRKDLIDKGYGQAKKYSWRKMAEETLDIYEDVLGNKSIS
jgi:glycosyltransferase involved in cell wall biosynthesis